MALGTYASDGPQLFDAELQLWTLHSTPSDAIFARIVLEHKLPYKPIGALLSLLSDANSQKADVISSRSENTYTLTASYRQIMALLNVAPDFQRTDVTFSRPEDIYTRTATYRQSVASQRDAVASIKQRSTRVPHVVFELLVEQLGKERDPLHFEKPSGVATDVTPPRVRDLQNLSLTCRSWTAPAQAILRRRHAINGLRNIRRFLRNPMLGPWLRELRYFLRSSAVTRPRDDAEDTCDFLVALLDNAPSLRVLYVEMAFNTDHSAAFFRRVLRKLEDLPLLEGLRLSKRDQRPWTDTPGETYIGMLWETLPKLSALRSLVLDGWGNLAIGVRGVDECLVSTLSNTLPDPRLLSLTLSTTDSDRHDSSTALWPAPFLRWLLTPVQAYLPMLGA